MKFMILVEQVIRFSKHLFFTLFPFSYIYFTVTECCSCMQNFVPCVDVIHKFVRNHPFIDNKDTITSKLTVVEYMFHWWRPIFSNFCNHTPDIFTSILTYHIIFIIKSVLTYAVCGTGFQYLSEQLRLHRFEVESV